MSLTVIKFVAGGGKTTYSENYIKENRNGIYLAFNNKVVDEISKMGFLSKTIDSLFDSFIIPKLTHLVPIIKNGAKIEFDPEEKLPPYLQGVSKIKIEENGDIYNCSSRTEFNMNISNEDLFCMNNRKNLKLVQHIFGKDTVKITNAFRGELSRYIIQKYPNQIIDIMKQRFSYIIIDEAQDLKDYREEFAKLLSNSNIDIIVLGDDYQNINGGGDWFSKLTPNEEKTYSYRCPEENCAWIRKHISEININGNKKNKGGVFDNISMKNIFEYDDGEKTLLYNSKSGEIKNIISKWKGPSSTIKTAKGQTIDADVVIVGNTLNRKNIYTAITRSTKCVYLAAKLNE